MALRSLDMFKNLLKCCHEGKKNKNEFARVNSHINGIESFLGYAKNRLVKFEGMDKKSSFL
jgi:hypothetical protein